MKTTEVKENSANKSVEKSEPDLKGMNAEELFNYIRDEIKQACQRKNFPADNVTKAPGINQSLNNGRYS